MKKGIAHNIETSYLCSRKSERGNIMKTSYETRVEFCDVDFNNKIKLPALFSYILIASDEHVHENNISPEMLRDRYSAAWVLVRMNMSIDTMPEYRDKMVIETWMENVNLKFATRYYKLYLKKDCSLMPIGQVSTVWTILDLNTRKICLDVFTNHEMWNNALDDEKIEMPVSRRKQDATFIENRMSQKVMYSDLDWNNHLNSGRYISMMMDVSPLLTSHTPINFSIKYSKEVSMNEVLSIKSLSSRDLVTYTIENQAGETVCSAMMDTMNK